VSSRREHDGDIAKEETMERPQIRKELFDLTLCIETLLHMIDKGSPLNSSEKEFIVRLADTLRDGTHVNRHAAASGYEKRASDSIGSAGEALKLPA
jgi:hypothetical protein